MHPERTEEPALARGAALGRFVVLGCVGRGAMGEVYAAYDPDLDRKIAIKLVRADRAGDPADNRARLMREAQATAKVAHPNVVVVYDAGTAHDRVFIAMEFVEGHTLRYWLQERARSWPEILEVFVSAGRGLAAAHERDLVHRDFKPDNVMIGSGGHVRVMDFGLARAASAALAALPPSQAVASHAGIAIEDVDATAVVQTGTRTRPRSPSASTLATATATLDTKLTQTGAVLGTPAYMSPEQFQGRAADARSDQFSFCVSLWEALYGTRPFAGKSFDELAEAVTAGKLTPPPADGAVPGWIHTALVRALRPRPEDRFESMSALLDQIDRRPVSGRGGFAAGAAAKLAGIWEAPAGGRPVETPEKAAMRQAFLSTGKAYADAAFAGAAAVLDRYARRWTDLYIDVCEATHVRGEQSAEVLDLRMACLLEGLADLKALCRQFQGATAAVVENAVSAATALGTLERCEDVDLLRAVVRPPDDPATRAAVAELRAHIVEVRVLLRVGRYREGIEAAGPLVERARQVGYLPTLAEALLVLGALALETGRPDTGRPAIEEAVWTAEQARHDEVAAEAATYMVSYCGYVEAHFDLAETWIRHSEMLLRRMGGHDWLWGWHLNNRAMVREHAGRMAEAIADDRLAIEAKQRALGAAAPDVGITTGNMAAHLVQMGELAQGLEIAERAVEILRAGFGPTHPKTAIARANQAEFLCQVGRFAEAHEIAVEALSVFEREFDPEGLHVSYPLMTLGLACLGAGRPHEAVPVLERATSIREAARTTPERIAEARFALGRALFEGNIDRARGIALARQAGQELAREASQEHIAAKHTRVQSWLAERGGAPVTALPNPAG